MKEVDNPAMRSVMGPEWVKAQTERMLRTERLYVLDGRHLKGHEKHGFYTGLYEKAEELEKELME
tara:strand:- start:3097 stop:3291 length:195 start_codon:yes stop_codon:yes gene_type:complete